VTKDEALRKAVEAGVDLVEVVAKANPPICRIIDFKKFKYLESKKEKESKKKHKGGEVKEVRLSPFIGEHDLNTQLKKTKEFLHNNNRVKFVVKFAGRQMAKTDFGRVLLNRVSETLKEEAKIERDIKMEGRQMVMIIAPI
jgi:translation initiation factor IF-3